MTKPASIPRISRSVILRMPADVMEMLLVDGDLTHLRNLTEGASEEFAIDDGFVTIERRDGKLRIINWR